MKQVIFKGDFRDEFVRMGRKDNFSYEGLGALYDFLEDVDSEHELDVIELCCEFAEDDIEVVLKDYNLGSIEELRDRTIVVWEGSGRVLYQQG